MDRTAYTWWARILLPVGTVLPFGCDSGPSPPTAAPTSQQSLAPELFRLTGDSQPRPIDSAAIMPVQYPSLSDDRLVLPPLVTTDPLSTPPAADGPELSVSETDTQLAGPAAPPAIEQQSPIESKLATEDTASAPSSTLPFVSPDASPTQSQTISAIENPVAERVDLPWARTGPHTNEMAAVIARAEAISQYGFELASRGAHFSARAQFVQSLTMLAQTLDAEQDTTLYSKALASGLLAMKEAEDFIVREASPRELDVARVISGHRTPLLKDVTASSVTPLVARQRYYTYAQEQLAAATGQEPAGSLALYGLGKLALAKGRPGQPQSIEDTAQAMVCYQAALMADGRNYWAANELGVLLARNGKWERSRDLFLHSLAIAPQATIWHNLAAVHQRLGETQLAEQARSKALAAGNSGTAPNVRWVDAKTFANSTPSTDGLVAPTPAANPAPSQAGHTPTAAVPKKSTSHWFPWNQPARR